jgi:hypothetical protein
VNIATSWSRSTLLAMLSIIAPTACLAQSGSALDPLLQHALDSRKNAVGEAQNYTYTEHSRNINYDKSGKETLNFTDTYEIIFLEGAPYPKHVFHNEKPLSEKEQKAEDKKFADVARARREQKDKRGLFSPSFHFELPLDQLATDFNTTSDGAAELDGLNNLVFTALPKSEDPAALKQAAHDGTAWEMKFWVDEHDGIFRKIEGKAIAEGMRYEKDTIVTYEWKKVNGEAWLPVRFWFKGKVRYLMRDIPAEAEQIYSDYKKFHADTKVITQ